MGCALAFAIAAAPRAWAQDAPSATEDTSVAAKEETKEFKVANHWTTRGGATLRDGMALRAQFSAGTANNIIPNVAELRGTVRTFTPEDRDLAQDELTRIAEGVASSLGGRADVEYVRGYAPTVNDEAMAELVRGAAIKVLEGLAAEQASRGHALLVRAPSPAARLSIELSGLLAAHPGIIQSIA